MTGAMRVLSLCTGIGGIDLACEAASMEIVGQVEIDEFCNRVLAAHWPHVKRMRDIFEVKGDEFGAIDLVVAGFPCQPVSGAGKRRGQADARWLWPEVARIIRACQPAWVLLENVPGLISLGLDDVLGDLESAGYEAAACVYPAAAVGAPHERERVFIVGRSVAHSAARGVRRGRASGSDRLTAQPGEADVAHASSGGRRPNERNVQARQSNASRCCALADACRSGARVHYRAMAQGERARRPCGYAASNGGKYGSAGQTQPCLGDAAHGLPGWLAGHRGLSILSHRWPARPGEAQYAFEPPRTLPASDRTPGRAAKLKALGNAVVPQQCYPLLLAIAQTWEGMHALHHCEMAEARIAEERQPVLWTA